MKIKKLKVSAATVIMLILLFGYKEYKEYKLKQEAKTGKILTQTEVEIDDIVEILPPTEDINDVELAKPTVKH